MTVLHTEDGAPVRTTNRLPVELYGPDGNPLFATRRLAADNLVLPTAPDVLATLLAYDGATLDLLRVALGTDSNVNTTGLVVNGHKMQFNGSLWERERGNVEGTLLASAARTATTNSATQTNHNGRGVQVIVNVTAAGTGDLDPRVQGLDPVSGTAYACLDATTPIAGTGIYVYELYPGASTAGSGGGSAVTQRAAGTLPRSWRLSVAHSDASSWTYSVAFSLLV